MSLLGLGLGECVAALIAAWLLTLGLEQALKPRPRLRARPGSAHLVHLALVLGCFSLLLSLLQRPLFAAALSSALFGLFVLVSNAKYRALREPLVFTDIALYSQAVKHPRLYLPFLGLGPAIAIPLVTAICLYAGFSLETSLLHALRWPQLFGLGAGGILLAGLLLWIGHRGLPAARLEPGHDLQQLGLLSSLWLYHRACRHRPCDHPSSLAPTGTDMQDHHKPHVVAVQSESFFDARRLHPHIRPEVLKHYDRVCTQARRHGMLAVPAWGANTMRTEFTFLTGIDNRQLAGHRFNPFQTLVRKPIRSLASELRVRGYRTLCIHPYPAGFFQRERVYPQLGFDEFMDIAAFMDAEYYGPYISDAAVSEKIEQVLEQAEQPTFVFVITMENHGPLHLEKVAPGDEDSLYDPAAPDGVDDLTVYLRHLKNADRMIGRLTGLLESGSHPALLCFYGDHVPGMPGVFSTLDYHDEHSDYFIWSSRRGGPTEKQDLPAHQLPRMILDLIQAESEQTT